MNHRGDRVLDWRHAGVVAAAKGVASAVVLASGFRAVSDDDFARVVIAEQWARAPRWDASGTSWLPFPFWITGSAMIALGRGLVAARATAVALGVAAAVVVYVAARWLGEERAPATASGLAAALFPWSARLGVATVPELPTAALTLLGMAALGGEAKGRARERRLLWGAAALAAAALSRYEAWPVATIFAAVTAFQAMKARSGRLFAAAVIALSGPVSWVIWNRVAHGDALHFLARVAAYKQALGGGEPGAAARLWAYPLATVTQEPEIAALLIAAVGLVALREGAGGVRAALSRYAVPAGIVATQIAALSAAMLKDGAPTHHPERAVLTALLLMAVCAGALACRALVARSTSPARVGLARHTESAECSGTTQPWQDFGRAVLGGGAWKLAVIAGAAAAASIVVRPRAAREAFARRGDEVAAGRAAAALAAPGERVLVEVADYGYLAVIAALGRPEDAVADRSIDPRQPKSASSFDDAAAVTKRVADSGARWAAARAAEPARAALGEPAATRGAWGVFRAGREIR